MWILHTWSIYIQEHFSKTIYFLENFSKHINFLENFSKIIYFLENYLEKCETSCVFWQVILQWFTLKNSFPRRETWFGVYLRKKKRISGFWRNRFSKKKVKIEAFFQKVWRSFGKKREFREKSAICLRNNCYLCPSLTIQSLIYQYIYQWNYNKNLASLI